MSQHQATSPFTVDSFETASYDEGPGATLSRGHVSKTFTGDVVGSGVVEMLSVYTASGPAAYVAIERVTAAVHGRQGGFIFQHSAEMGPQGPSLQLTIVPGTGSGELVGITGSGRIQIDDRRNHTLFLEYDLD
jgi:hypothetical protein